MKICRCLGLLIPLVCIAGQIRAENEIVFTPEQVSNLGLITSALAPAKQRPLFTAPGMVRVPPTREIVVTEPNGGVVKQIYVSEGEAVRQGQKLVEIISSGLVGLQKELLIAQSRYELARRQFNREKSLFENGVIAEKRLQEADMQFQQARIARDEARQMLAIAGFSDPELQRLMRTERLENSRIIAAPVAGIVLRKFIVTGQRVEDHDPLFSIADLSRLWVEAAAPQVDIEQIATGDVMEIPNTTLIGRIFLIDSKVDEKHQSVMVRAVVDQPDGRIRPGQSLQVRFRRTDAQDLFVAPPTSLVRHEGQTLLFVRSKNGFIPRVVEAMGESDGNVIIKGNLGPNDQVAVQGTIAIKAHWLGFGGRQ